MKLLIVISALLSLKAFAAEFYLKETKVVGADKSLKEVTKELLIQSLIEKGHTVIEDKKDAPNVLSTSVLKLNESYVLTLRVAGEKSSSIKVKTKDLDDMDMTVSRAVKALLKGKDFKDTMKVYEVTKEEQDRVNRKLNVGRYWLFGFGPAFYSNMLSDEGIAFSMGYVWSFDENFDLALKYDFGSETDDMESGYGYFGFSGNYFFNGNIHSPYVTGGLGWGKFSEDKETSTFGKENVEGWMYQLGGGMKFYRASDVNFGAEVTYTGTTKDLRGEKPGFLAFKFNVYF